MFLTIINMIAPVAFVGAQSRLRNEREDGKIRCIAAFNVLKIETIENCSEPYRRYTRIRRVLFDR